MRRSLHSMARNVRNARPRSRDHSSHPLQRLLQQAQSLNRFSSTNYIRTIAHHPEANSVTENRHSLPSSLAMDANTTSGTIVYPSRMTRHLSCNISRACLWRNHSAFGRLLIPSSSIENQGSTFTLRSTPSRRRQSKTTTLAFIRHDAVRNSLQMPYDGPYAVISRSDKTLVVSIRGKSTTVSLNQLKPAFIFTEQQYPL